MSRRGGRFFDACAGIGCFHLGMSAAGYECVGAAEYDEGLFRSYPKAFSLPPERMFKSVHKLIEEPRWRDVRESLIGSIMTAGFPCTPFSKSGPQTGRNHAEGGVFWSICEMMEDLQSPAFIFENVTNLLGKKHEKIWIEMRNHLTNNLGYKIGWAKISTKDLGIPQNRNRVFIVGIKSDKPSEDFFRSEFQEILSIQKPLTNLTQILQTKHRRTPLRDSHKKALLVWDQYFSWLVGNPKLIDTLTKPLWGMEGYFRKLYNLEKLQEIINNSFPNALTKEQICNSLLISNQVTKDMKREEIMNNFLPPYFRKVIDGDSNNYEDRMIFASKSQSHMEVVENWVCMTHGPSVWDNWLNQLVKLEVSHQKLEWHLGKNIPNKALSENVDRRLGKRLGQNLVQFRSSGIRISNGTVFPTLVAIGQVPYTGNPLRQPSWQALARLQSIPDNFVRSNRSFFEKNDPVKRIGNSVNCNIVELLGKKLAPHL